MLQGVGRVVGSFWSKRSLEFEANLLVCSVDDKETMR